MFDTKPTPNGTLATPRHTTPRSRAMLLMLCAVSAIVCATLSGCATAAPADAGAGLSADFGDATRHNQQAQFVAPTPEQKADTYIPPNAARQALALETYEAGEVELERVVSD